jgi:hypothetical protein
LNWLHVNPNPQANEEESMKTLFIVKHHSGWGIDTRSKDHRHGLIGKHWWFSGHASQIPPQLSGYVSAIFATRAQARAALPAVKTAFPRAQVVRLDITITGG